MDKNQLTEELMKSIFMEDISEMKRLIEAGADINSLGVNNNSTIVTPLGRACAQGNREMVLELIKLGADINLNDTSIINRSGGYYARVSSPIILATQNGYDMIVSDLINAGVDLEAVDQDGNTALNIAVQKNKRDLVKGLIAAKASLSPGSNAINVLAIAVKNNNEEIVNDLLDAGAKNPSSISSLAFKEGHLKLAKNLLERGYAFNSYLTHMENSFLNAYYKNKVEDYAKNPSLINQVAQNGETLLLTVSKNNLSELSIKLIKAGATLYNQDKAGNTVLLHAAYYQNDEVIKAAVDAGADVNQVNSRKKNALILTPTNIDVLDLLIKAGANKNHQDEDGNTAVMYSTLDMNESVLDFYISIGADLNLQNKEGLTALMMASECMNNYRSAPKLLDADADINILDKAGRNAYDHAVSNDRDTIVDLIKQKAKENSPEGVISKIFGLRKSQNRSSLKNTG